MKATHKGNCQVCNKLHKLPDGVLSAHGYTVESRGFGGWFSGTCHGSHNLPFQRDRKLVDLSILKAREEITGITGTIEKQKSTPADSAKAWRQHRVRGHISYDIWVQVELVATHEQNTPALTRNISTAANGTPSATPSAALKIAPSKEKLVTFGTLSSASSILISSSPASKSALKHGGPMPR